MRITCVARAFPTLDIVSTRRQRRLLCALPSAIDDVTLKKVVVQAVKSAGAKVVAAFASLDRQLQKAGILPELKPVKLPAEVRDESGQLAADCAEVGHPAIVSHR